MPASPAPASGSGGAKLLQLLGLWGLALAMSAALAAAGRHWPDPLPVRGDVVLALLLVPALAVVIWLAVRWPLDGTPLEPLRHPGPHRRGGESSDVEQESV